ncbi:MAG: UDP-N-acetylglucosamine 1-carboxyvinyltransferase [Campylobacterota bacterium]
MDYLKIKGGRKLGGSVRISGAKNAALPLMAATLLSSSKMTLSNLPDVADLQTLLKLFEKLGSQFSFQDNTLTIQNDRLHSTVANYDIVRTMRASILVLGPLLARFGHCEVSLPGGCAIGQRPIDLHLSALEKMGATIDIQKGYVIATAKEGLKGAKIVFDKVTVTGSENIIMAASLARGKTHLVNVAKEPEVVQLCRFLEDAGVQIEGIGSDELVIYGRDCIDLGDIEVIADRIEAGTYLCAGAITNSRLTVQNVNYEHLEAVMDKLESMGCSFRCAGRDVTILPAKTLKPVQITTSEYPGFPTDMQAQFMALATQAEGTSTIEEKLFENRFMHVSELLRLGADISLSGHIATIKGKTVLSGADLMATDLRASSALVLAALVSANTTNIHRIYHLDRGYEHLEEKLKTLGADIKRLKE